ncbi:hypothetical protein [Halorientalis sp.]|uniref:hypothetical protein n=1 Tax=Halorientalis sp. TaxID=1931229 RepID=UPI002622161E|nr:hypothetical protein [Halorientalis sp.]
MPRETDTAERAEDDRPAERNSEADRGGFDRRLLSDLFVNVVPIATIVAGSVEIDGGECRSNTHSRR